MPGGQFLGDGRGIWQGPGQPVQLGHHKGVAVSQHAATVEPRADSSAIHGVLPVVADGG